MQEKRVLLIAPSFFGYYKEIIKELEKKKYTVDYVCDAPSNSNVLKAFGRINKKIIGFFTKKYFNKNIWPNIKDKKYEYVILICGMTYSLFPSMIELIKKNNNNARFILYQWDSSKNLSYLTEIKEYFDNLYSFDRQDCIDDKRYKFLPLFYIDSYKNIGSRNENSFKYDCSYVGTAHPKKYKEINEISQKIKDKMPNQYIYHYMPSNLKFIYHKIFAPEYKKAKITEFQKEKLSTDELMKVFKESRCILDAPQFGQTGLTIRTIECLGAKKKIITSNKDIINYDFYNESNVLIYDGKIDYNSKFFNEGYKELNDEIYMKYSLTSWIDEILKGDC